MVKEPLRSYRVIRWAFCLIGVLLLSNTICERTLSYAVDTLDLQLQWTYPIAVVDLKLVDFDNDGINEILVGFNSDSAQVGILDAVTETLVWQSSGFDGIIYTVASGDRNNDGYLDIVCGGRRSDTLVGYIEVFEGPTFSSVYSMSGFNDGVLSAAISERGLDSLPQIFLGTSFYQESCWEDWLGENCLCIWSGRVHVLDGQNLAVEDSSGYGTVREMLVLKINGDTHDELFLGMDYREVYTSPHPGDYQIAWSKVNQSLFGYSQDFFLYNGPWTTRFEALEVGSFNGGVSYSIIASVLYSETGDKNKLACWNASTTELEWSVESVYDFMLQNHIIDLAVCSFKSEETNAICAAYRNGLIEFKSGSDGSNLAIVPQLHPIYELEVGNVDQDHLVEICVTSGDSLYVYETEFLTTDVEETEDYLHPENFSLFQNYPNPFNPETDISFSLPERTQVFLIVYNILGEKIKILVNGEVDAGTHTIHWDGRNEAGNSVATGIYLYRLKTESFDQTRKMVLVK